MQNDQFDHELRGHLSERSLPSILFFADRRSIGRPLGPAPGSCSSAIRWPLSVRSPVLAVVFAGRLEPWQIYVTSAINAASAHLSKTRPTPLTVLVPEVPVGRASGMVQMASAVREVLAPALAGVSWSRSRRTGACWRSSWQLQPLRDHYVGCGAHSESCPVPEGDGYRGTLGGKRLRLEVQVARKGYCGLYFSFRL